MAWEFKNTLNITDSCVLCSPEPMNLWVFYLLERGQEAASREAAGLEFAECRGSRQGSLSMHRGEEARLFLRLGSNCAVRAVLNSALQGAGMFLPTCGHLLALGLP